MMGTCERCGAMIYLVKAGATEDSYKWVTKPEKPLATWKCSTTKDFPVRSHSPIDIEPRTAAGSLD